MNGDLVVLVAALEAMADRAEAAADHAAAIRDGMYARCAAVSHHHAGDPS